MRYQLRKQRKTITKPQRYIFAKKLLHNLLTTNILKQQNIALYLPNDGEMPTHKIIKFLQKYNKNIYVPILMSKKLKFAKLGTKFRLNKFKIPEPVNSQIIHAKKLNLILMPLVGFDENCNRIGMGGGFYDKTLSFKLKQKYYKNPKLYGLAYDLQKTQITPKLWDIKLDKIITNKQIYK
jgi:5-formyltetrahydrofolate cyclo-ligase